MAKAYQLCSTDGTMQVFVSPFTCGDLDGTTVIVERRCGPNVCCWEQTLGCDGMTLLQEIIKKVKAFHQSKPQEWLVDEGTD